MIYTDGSKLANGTVGSGWAIYHCGDQQLYSFTEGRCHLGSRVEVFDAELNAVQEAVSTLLTTTLPRSTVFICIDNQAAIDTLHFNRYNHEYA
jgi:ribonuclease HI